MTDHFIKLLRFSSTIRPVFSRLDVKLQARLSETSSYLAYWPVFLLYRFKRKQFVIPAFEHEYRHGFQHLCNKWVKGSIRVYNPPVSLQGAPFPHQSVCEELRPPTSQSARSPVPPPVSLRGAPFPHQSVCEERRSPTSQSARSVDPPPDSLRGAPFPQQSVCEEQVVQLYWVINLLVSSPQQQYNYVVRY